MANSRHLDRLGMPLGTLCFGLQCPVNFFLSIPDTLTCRHRKMMIILEGERPHYRSCGATEHLYKVCPEKKPVSRPQLTDAVRMRKSGKTPEGLADWKDILWRELTVNCKHLLPKGCPTDQDAARISTADEAASGEATKTASRAAA